MSLAPSIARVHIHIFRSILRFSRCLIDALCLVYTHCLIGIGASVVSADSESMRSFEPPLNLKRPYRADKLFSDPVISVI